MSDAYRVEPENVTSGIAPGLDENGFPLPGHDDTPDGEAARGSGVGVIGAGGPIAEGRSDAPEDLQEDMGEDPTLADEGPGD